MSTRRQLTRVDRRFAAAILGLSVVFSTTWLLATQRRMDSNAAAATPPARVSRALPGIGFTNGRRLAGPGAGPVTPMAMAAGDFDEDGVPDLITAAGAGGRGLIALYRGNVDALFPGSPEALERRASRQFTDSAFWPAVTFAIDIVPEFLAAGDFDADGHVDLAASGRGANTLVLLPGDGGGGFGEARAITLPGMPTAMAAGEVNRADGLADIVVAVTGPRSSSLWVFEGPDGAVHAAPVAIPLPAPAAALALGHLDDDANVDVAAIAGHALVIRHSPENVAVRHELPFEPTAVAVGTFADIDGGQDELALLDRGGTVHILARERGVDALSWRVTRSAPAGASADGHLVDTSAPLLVSATVSSSRAQDAVVVDRASRRLYIVPPAERPPATRLPAIIEVAATPIAVLPMRLNGDAMADLVILQDGEDAPTVMLTTAGRTFTVNDPGDAPDCDTTDDMCRIGPLDASGNCTGGCTFRAALNQANANPDLDTIAFALGSGTPTIVKRGGADWTAVSPVTINGNTGGATRVHLDANGAGNTLIVQGGSSTIRNLVVTGGSPGIQVSVNGNNFLEGNWVGLDPTGTSARGNAGDGIVVNTSGNTIGGTTAAARNVVSGNGQDGIEIRNGTGNKVLGNYIGTDATGVLDLGNALSGVRLELANNTVIGGTTAGARNVISGNDGAGVLDAGVVANISPGLQLQGNYVGTTATGNAALGNAGPGVRLVSGFSDVVGGTTAAARNVIAGNGSDGLIIRSPAASANTIVRGNYIGTAVNGVLLGNAGHGIAVHGSHDNTIGGTTTGAANRIAGNTRAGVALQFAGAHPGGNGVRGNSIYANALLGVDLGADGVTLNDPCDVDTGANGRQNFPVLTSVSGTTTVQGTLNSTASTTFTLDFYSSSSADASGFGEGQTFLGSKTVTANASCTANFTATFSKPVPVGHVVTATATGPGNNTSEFSAGVVAPGAVAVTSPNTAVNWGVGSVQRITWTHNFPSGSTMKIEVSRDGGATWALVAAAAKNGAGTGSYNWAVTGPSTTQARIRVTSNTDPSVSDASNVNFAIADPFVTVTRPNLSSHVWTIGTTQTIQWASNLGSAESVSIELSKDGGTTYPVVIFAGTPSDGKQAVTVLPAWATPTARVRITWLKDPAVTDASDEVFPVQ